jgi:outer membrane lipoprotein-sorting protein
MLRTSVVPTIVQGGFQRNVIPAEAEATLDTRAVPDENFDELLQQLRKLIDDPAVEVVLNPAYRTISPPSKLDSEMYKALVVAQQKLYPKTFTIPQMGTGATDSSELRAKGVQAYGVHSPQTAADQATVHGNDERVQVEGVNEFVRYLRIAVEQVAATHAAVELNQGPAGYASSLEDVLAAMDAAAAKFSSAQANFSSEQYEAVVKERNTQAGVLYIRRAGDRVDMAADFNQPSDQRKYVLFTNGKVQLYQPKINQVTVYDAGKNKEALQSFLILGFGSRGHDLEKQFEIKYSGTENLQGIKTAKLELTPRAERVRSMFDRIVLWVDPARGVATQQQFFEPSGNYRLVKYATITNNGKLPHDAFKLKTKGIPTTVTNP